MTEGKTFNLPHSNKDHFFRPSQTTRSNPDLAGSCAELTGWDTSQSDVHHTLSTHGALFKYLATNQKKQKKRLLDKGGAEGRPVASSTLITLILLNGPKKVKKLKIGNRNREYIITQQYPGRWQTQYYHSARQVSAQDLAALTSMTSGLAETGQTWGDPPTTSDFGNALQRHPVLKHPNGLRSPDLERKVTTRTVLLLVH